MLSISEKTVDYARRVQARLRQEGVRTAIDDSDDRIGAKIKAGADARVPYLLVVGPRDQESESVSPRVRGVGDRGAMPLEEFVTTITAEIRQRRLTLALGDDE